MAQRLHLWLTLLALTPLSGQDLFRVGDVPVEARLSPARPTASGERLVALETAFGTWTVAQERVVSGQDGAIQRLLADYSRMRDRKDTEPATLAFFCHDQGLWSGLRAEMNRILRESMDDPWCVAILTDLASKVQVHPAESGDRGRDHRKFARFLFEEYAKRDFVAAHLAVAKARELPNEVVYRHAMDALRHEDPRIRWTGARILAAHDGRSERIPRLFKHSLLDGAPVVRTEAARALAATNDEAFVNLFVKNLGHGHSGVRANAGDALGELGKASAVPFLIKALAAAGGAPRNHISVRTSRAYVKDFDVEIAQAAVIADPVVDVVSEGAILDVRVIGVVEERARFRGALRKLTGKDFGVDPAEWSRWWDSR